MNNIFFCLINFIMRKYRLFAYIIVFIMNVSGVVISNSHIENAGSNNKVGFINVKEQEIVNPVVGAMFEYSLPVEPLEIYEENGYIIVRTNEKSFVKCPFNCVVTGYQKDKKKGLSISLLNYSVYALGLEVVSFESGKEYNCGEILGSLEGDKLYLEAFHKSNKLSLEKVRKLLNV